MFGKLKNLIVKALPDSGPPQLESLEPLKPKEIRVLVLSDVGRGKSTVGFTVAATLANIMTTTPVTYHDESGMITDDWISAAAQRLEGIAKSEGEVTVYTVQTNRKGQIKGAGTPISDELRGLLGELDDKIQVLYEDDKSDDVGSEARELMDKILKLV